MELLKAINWSATATHLLSCKLGINKLEIKMLLSGTAVLSTPRVL